MIFLREKSLAVIRLIPMAIMAVVIVFFSYHLLMMMADILFRSDSSVLISLMAVTFLVVTVGEMAFARKKNKVVAVEQYNRGVAHFKGKGVVQDKKKAFALFQKAAEQELAQAQYNLGMMYANGDGVKQNKTKAVQWFEKAAEQGLTEAQKVLNDINKTSRAKK